MKHTTSHGHYSFGGHKGNCHTGGHSSKMVSHMSTSHHGGSHHGGSHQGGSHVSHHGGSHSSHLGGSHFSQHGGSHLLHHGSSHLSHHSGGSHHGSCHSSPHSAGSHHGSSHFSHHMGGFHLNHHGGFHKSHLSPHMSHLGGSHKMHHGSSHMSHGGSHLSHHGGSHLSHHGGSHGSNMSHHGSHHKSVSHHSGSSCKAVPFSKHASSSHYGGHGHYSSSGGHGGWKNDGLLSINEKQTMQILNERLSSYLDKVRALEQENAQLERKICEWYANNAPSSLPDSSQYFRTISELQNQIAGATLENARIILQIDNARLAADDFRDKYQMELSMRNNVESDVNALRRVLEGLNQEVCGLQMQVQNLQEELQEMKRNHEEEVNSLRAQLGARINVELNAAPSIDLNRALSEIRDEYENLMDRNLRDAENMFRQRSQELNLQVASGSEQLQSVQTEVIELKRTVQTLEIELQSQLSMTSALECTLAETQATYSSQIAQLQAMINSVESQLGQVRSDLERQNYEYKILMDQKTHLEMEIATYKRLLDGHDIHVSEHHMSSGKHGSHHKIAHHTTEHFHEPKC
ncbi:keratin, type I cytoskeletal 19-like [Dendrobates tinctorius]|uniref:keratin, type I cytoskeletal 19-like n=1 Tax=Dendrobates tinctorius TaxID=92724 RepID=UPI003CCA14CA